MEYYTCDVCGVSNDSVIAGRWIFYCPAHKDVDRQKTYDNEVLPALENDNLDSLDYEAVEILI